MRVERIGTATLYCEDALAMLPTLSSIGAVICDPPYGIRHSSSFTRAVAGRKDVKGHASWANSQIAGDADTSARDAVVTWLDGRPGAFCGTWKMPPPIGARGAVVWDKGPAFGMGDIAFPWKPSWELIFVVGEGWTGFRDQSVLRGSVVPSWESRGRTHPHEKPVWLMEHFIAKLPAELTILDPFAGSGTTGVAAVQSGRSFIGIELSPVYFDIACRRIEAATRQADMFVSAPQLPRASHATHADLFAKAAE